MPDLSILIVSFNARDDVARCLESLHAAPPVTAHEVVVIDNASTDGCPDMVRERWPGVRVIDAGANLGFAAANNLGFRATTSELVLLLNGDTVVPPGAIDCLVAELRADAATGVVGPRLVDGSGRVEISWGPMIGPFAELRQKLIGRLYDSGNGAVVSRVNRLARQKRDVDWVSGACLLVRRREAEAVGLLDERYFLYTEDVDFCQAIRALGRAVRFIPTAEVVHLRGRSRAHAPTRANQAYRRSQLAFYRKHHPRWAVLLRLYLALRGQSPSPLPASQPEEEARNTKIG